MKLFEVTSDIKFREMSGNEFYGLFNEPENEDVRKRIKYLSSGYRDIDGEHDIVAFDGKKIVGALGIWSSSGEKNVIAIPFVSVDPEYKSKGIARELIDRMFQYAKKKNLRVRGSTYTEQGEATIKSSMERLAKQYEVPFKDGSDHYKFDRDD